MIGLLALFGRRIAPTTLANIQEDAASIPPTALHENPTGPILSTTAQEDPADISPAVAKEDPASTSSAAAQDLANTSLAAAQDLEDMPPTNYQQQISPALVAYEMD